MSVYKLLVKAFSFDYQEMPFIINFQIDKTDVSIEKGKLSF